MQNLEEVIIEAGYIAVSVLTYGLPQTIRHLYKNLREMNVSRKNEEVNLYMSEAAMTAGVIIGQIYAIKLTYSSLTNLAM